MKPFRVLALVTDAYGGGLGGIAKYNRDVLDALAAMPGCSEVVCVPRHFEGPVANLPPRVRMMESAARGKWHYLMAVLRAMRDGRYDMVLIGHINLAALGSWVARRLGVPSWLGVYGIDAWTPHRSGRVRAALPRIDRIVGISRVTLERLNGWAKLDTASQRMLAPCIELAGFSPGPRNAVLVERFGLQDCRVVMTFGRLADEARAKGFDAVLDALPQLAQRVPGIVYLVCGDGPDRARLERKARTLGVDDRVRFTGLVPESQKADFYRLADVHVMPSEGEGFGIVVLEALACGVPTVGSTRDGTREALLEGRMGELVEPRDPGVICDAVVRALARPHEVPAMLEHFSMEAFARRMAILVSDILGAPAPELAHVLPAALPQ